MQKSTNASPENKKLNTKTKSINTIEKLLPKINTKNKEIMPSEKFKTKLTNKNNLSEINLNNSRPKEKNIVLTEEDRYIIKELIYNCCETQVDYLDLVTKPDELRYEENRGIRFSKIDFIGEDILENYQNSGLNVEKLKEIFKKLRKIARIILKNKKGDNFEAYENFDENIALLEKIANIIDITAYLNINRHSAFDDEDTTTLFQNVIYAYDYNFNDYGVTYFEGGLLTSLTEKLKNMDQQIQNGMTKTQKEIFEQLQQKHCLYIDENNHETFYKQLQTASITHDEYLGLLEKIESYIEKIEQNPIIPIIDEQTQILINLFQMEKNRMQNHYYKEKYHLKNGEEKYLFSIIYAIIFAATFDDNVAQKILVEESLNLKEDYMLEIFLNNFLHEDKLYSNANLLDIKVKDVFSYFESSFSHIQYKIVDSLINNIKKYNINININFDNVKKFYR